MVLTGGGVEQGTVQSDLAIGGQGGGAPELVTRNPYETRVFSKRYAVGSFVP